MHHARCVLDEVFGASNFAANVRDASVPPGQRRVPGAMALVKVIGHLTGGEFGDDSVAGRDAVLLRNLEEAVASLRQKPGGDSYTLNNTGGDNQTSGASFRIIVDTGGWDRAVGSNTPGHSGDPDSPFYDNLFELWANDRLFPVFYSRERVESVAAERTMPVPGG